MAKSKKIVRTWGSAMATTKAFFVDLPDLIKKSLISNQMSELEIARMRNFLREQIHYPLKKQNWGHINVIPNKHELEDK
tara:strand:- start:7 stop:243 length:237 start_codon:yes stop_codon:yes gene_type:complete